MFALLVALAAMAQVPSDSANVYFKISQWRFDPSLDGNAASMDSFIDAARAAYAEQNLDRIEVRAYASPDGPDNFNARLSARRCSTIVDLITSRTDIPRTLIRARAMGVSWEQLRKIVAETPDVPSRARILNIIDNTPVWIFDSNGKIVDGRKKQLMDLRGGRPYRWLLANIFPKMRSGVVISLWLKATPTAASETTETAKSSDKSEISGMSDGSDRTDKSDWSEESERSDVSDRSDCSERSESSESSVAGEAPTPRHILALKTNMLYYAALTPNLELEWLINDLWSVAVEGNVAWWGSYKTDKSFRLAVFDGEVRRWIKPRAPWHGLYIGLLAGGGYYDISNGDPGHYGSGLLGGLSVGYSWPIGKRLSLDAEIGVGYAFIHDKEYNHIDGHHVYARTKNINYFGPIKAKLSISWRFFDVNKSKRSKQAK